MLPRLPRSTLFPYTSLFRSHAALAEHGRHLDRRERALTERVAADLEARGTRRTDRALRAGLGVTLGRERRSEEHTSELQSRRELVCRLRLEKKKKGRIPALP